MDCRRTIKAIPYILRKRELMEKRPTEISKIKLNEPSLVLTFLRKPKMILWWRREKTLLIDRNVTYGKPEFISLLNHNFHTFIELLTNMIWNKYWIRKTIKTLHENRIWNKSGRKHKTCMFWMHQEIRADGHQYELKYIVSLVSDVSNFRLCLCSETNRKSMLFFPNLNSINCIATSDCNKWVQFIGKLLFAYYSW